RGIAVRVRLRAGNCGYAVASRNELEQFIYELRGHRRAETGYGIPAGSGTETLNTKRRVIAARHVVERCGVKTLRLADLIEGRIDKAQVVSGVLIGDCHDG